MARGISDGVIECDGVGAIVSRAESIGAVGSLNGVGSGDRRAVRIRRRGGAEHLQARPLGPVTVMLLVAMVETFTGVVGSV